MWVKRLARSKPTNRHAFCFYIVYLLAVSLLASRGFAPKGDQKKIKVKFVKGPRKSPAKKRTKEYFCNKEKDHGGVIFFVFWGVGGVPPPKKIA